MKMQRFWVGRALLLAVAVLYAGGYVRAEEAKDTLTLTLDRALGDCFKRQSYHKGGGGRNCFEESDSQGDLAELASAGKH